MAASKPTYQMFNTKQSFYTQSFLRSLAYDLGCFPLDLEPSRSKSAYSLKINPLISFTNIKEAYQAFP